MNELYKEALRLEIEAMAFEQELSVREISEIMEYEIDIDEIRAIIRRSVED